MPQTIIIYQFKNQFIIRFLSANLILPFAETNHYLPVLKLVYYQILSANRSLLFAENQSLFTSFKISFLSKFYLQTWVCRLLKPIIIYQFKYQLFIRYLQQTLDKLFEANQSLFISLIISIKSDNSCKFSLKCLLQTNHCLSVL